MALKQKDRIEYFVPILASGTGTTAEFVIRATQTDVLYADTSLVISNNADAGVFDRVEQLNGQYDLNIQTAHIGPKPGDQKYSDNPYEQTVEESKSIYETIMEQADGRPTVVLLAGYLRKLRGPALDKLDVYNTHPAILPATKGTYGMQAHRKVAQLRLIRSAQILHKVTADYDEGPIVKINKFPVPVAPEGAAKEEIEKIAKAIEGIAQNTEKAHLPKDLDNLLLELQGFEFHRIRSI